MSLPEVARAKFLLDRGSKISRMYFKQQRCTPEACRNCECRCNQGPSDKQKDADRCQASDCPYLYGAGDLVTHLCPRRRGAEQERNQRGAGYRTVKWM